VVVAEASGCVRVYPEPELCPVPVYRPQVQRQGPKPPPPKVEPPQPLWQLLSGPEACSPLFGQGLDLPLRNPQWGIA
jgi:hypothetical protein